MTPAALDSWIAFAKEWQPLLAGLLAVIASLIFAAGIIIAAKIRAGKPSQAPQKTVTHDLRKSVFREPVNSEPPDNVLKNLEVLRSLLRSALSALSSVDADDTVARALCVRIAAFQWRQFAITADVDQRTRETYATFLNQFELLRKVLQRGWSKAEASTVLIQLNAGARSLIETLGAAKSGTKHAPLEARLKDSR